MSHRFGIACGVLASVCAAAVLAAPRRATAPRKAAARPVAAPAPAVKTRALTAEEARLDVAMLGDAYDLLLQEIHSTYHTRPSVPVAASVIRKVQERMAARGWPRARYLAVNAIVMHPDHVPRDAFEKRCVEKLSRQDEPIEETLDGRLRVATVVPLGGSCSSCHWSRDGQSKAAISWNIPLLPETKAGR